MTIEVPRSGLLPGDSEVAFGVFASCFVRDAPTFIGLCDTRLRPCFLNAAARAMLGLSPTAHIGAFEIVDFFAPRHRDIVSHVGLPGMLQSGSWEDDLCFRHFTDPLHETEVRWSAFVLRDDSGQFLGAAAFASDRSTRDRTERALHDQQMLLASVLDNLPLGVGVYDRKGDLIHSNQRMRDYTGVARLPSRDLASSPRWRSYDAAGRQIPPEGYPGSRALRGEHVTPGIDFLYRERNARDRWARVSAVPLCREGEEVRDAIVVVQDVDDLKRAIEQTEAARAELASQSRFLDATLSSIPDYVYAFDPERRFAYANPAMLALFGLSNEEMLGKTFADLDYPTDLADRLNADIDHVLREGSPIEGEVFFRSRTGHAAYFSYLWGPVRAEDGTIELVVGVSRETSERRAVEERLAKNEARLRAATELVGLGIYAWDPLTGVLTWDDRLRAMWGLPPDAPVDMDVYEGGIHPEDLVRVRRAIEACVDPKGDGRFSIEYRVNGRDGVMRHVATFGRTIFDQGRAIDFIGVANDVTAQRRAEAAMRESEAQFRSFAEHSSNLMWIGDPMAGEIIYRSAAYERIWGVSCDEGATKFSEWMKDVHIEDRTQVERAFEALMAGDVAHFEYRIIRPSDGMIRWLRDTGFPIRDEQGTVIRIGGITEDLTQDQEHQVYIVSTSADEARWLASLARSAGHRTRRFDSASAFLDMAPVLAPGCVLVSLRNTKRDNLSIARELRARSITLPVVMIDGPNADITSAVSAMKAGAVDYLALSDEEALGTAVAHAIAECHGTVRTTTRDETAGALIARLTPREREVLTGLVEGGTNKTIAQGLGISPRTVELHRAQVMNRLNATSLTQLLQIALVAGLAPMGSADNKRKTP